MSFTASTAELAHGEKSRTQSLTQSPSLFDVPGTEAFTLEHNTFLQSHNINVQADLGHRGQPGLTGVLSASFGMASPYQIALTRGYIRISIFHCESQSQTRS